MNLIVNIPNSIYANLQKINHNSIAGKRVLDCVKIGQPIKDDNVSRNLEKQVELEADGYWDGKLVYDFGKCPNCGRQWEEGDLEWEEPFCCHCGQKLHWFDEETEDD